MPMVPQSCQVSQGCPAGMRGDDTGHNPEPSGEVDGQRFRVQTPGVTQCCPIRPAIASDCGWLRLLVDEHGSLVHLANLAPIVAVPTDRPPASISRFRSVGRHAAFVLRNASRCDRGGGVLASCSDALAADGVAGGRHRRWAAKI